MLSGLDLTCQVQTYTMRRCLRGILLLIVAVAVAGVGQWAWVPPHPDSADCRLNHNAAWIGVEWTMQPVSRQAVQRLASNARMYHLRYLYPFTTYLTAEGTFNPTYDHAPTFIEAFRTFDSDTLLLAWVGIPLESERRLGIDGWVDLSDVKTRAHIVAFAADLITDAGFDGVHLDVETVHDGDPHYLALLEETRAAIGDGAVLSVASAYWLPGAVNRLPAVRGYKWNLAYYRQVAARVDQIVTMTYDSVMPHPALYRLWIREQARAISRGLAHSNTELLVGISASRERTLTHRPYAENVASGLDGICAYVGGASSDPHIAGVALYAAWEATEENWQYWACALGD